MPYAITLETLQILGRQARKRRSQKDSRGNRNRISDLRKKGRDSSPTKKLEIKDELTKELITKAEFYGEIKVLHQKMQTLRQEMLTIKTELDRKFTLMFSILLFAIVFLNQLNKN